MIVELHTLPAIYRWTQTVLDTIKPFEIEIDEEIKTIDTTNDEEMSSLTEGEFWLVNKVIREQVTITIGNTIATPKLEDN